MKRKNTERHQKSVSVSRSAYARLTELADSKRLTLSEAISMTLDAVGAPRVEVGR